VLTFAPWRPLWQQQKSTPIHHVHTHSSQRLFCTYKQGVAFCWCARRRVGMLLSQLTSAHPRFFKNGCGTTASGLLPWDRMPKHHWATAPLSFSESQLLKTLVRYRVGYAGRKALGCYLTRAVLTQPVAALVPHMEVLQPHPPRAPGFYARAKAPCA
jgi:hypothetical protein